MINNKHNSPGKVPGVTQSPEDDARASIWFVGLPQVVAAILGIILYGLLSHVNLIILVPTGTLDVFLPALLIPLLFGVIYGPWVGLITGGFGFLLGDYVANLWLHDLSWGNGYLFYGSALINFRDLIGWNGFTGYLANGMIGLVAGLTQILTRRRYNNFESLATVGVLTAAGVALGIAIVVYSAVLVYHSPYYRATEATMAFLDTTLPNLLFALVMLPLLLFIGDAIVWSKGRA